ncbi:LptA/OstA family protein [Methylobacterium planeticum]|uniref:Organic solvent tolerance protein OstA n=1 Tax=Methylobacterium planeticum TaxID=2615211 RepID=A0A6N6MXB6_9HYPH|nr:LptA/OstA family protein [Methylobacterium planeticum]KAB1075711.1 organic solvent tolerance protein OstA [Methylobacterium planeticum]
MTRSRLKRLAGSGLALCLLAGPVGLPAAGPALAQKTGGASPAPAAAPAKKEASPLGALGGGGKEPIKIDADRLDVFDRENKAVFVGNVVAVQGDSTIRCSTMTVHYKRGKDAKDAKKGDAPAADEAEKPAEKAAMGENGIQKVECAGPVTVVQKDQVATGDNAVFDQAAKRIVLTGNVVLSQCQNVTRGSRLVYDMGTGRANMDPVAGGRVSALFVPGEKADAKGGSKGCATPGIAKAAPKPGGDKPGGDKPAEDKPAAEIPAGKPRAQAN